MNSESGKAEKQQKYEARDAGARNVSLAAAGLVGGILVSLIVVAVTMKFLGAIQSPFPGLNDPSWRTGSFPRLQVQPEKDDAALRKKNAAKLEGYDWTDSTAGTVHIPIERAMDLVAQQGWRGEAGHRDTGEK